MRPTVRLLLASSCLFAMATAHADPPGQAKTGDTQFAYFEQHAEGWFWYHDPKIEAPPPPAPAATPVPVPDTDPVAAIDAERRQLEVALDQAILHPTPDNVKAYLVLNQQLMNQAGTFADAWRGAIWMNPELDHRLVSPTGAAAYVQADITSSEQEARLSAASRDWGLLFFFRGSCPYCHRFAPVLKEFAARYGFHLVPITLDGGNLPDFPNPQTNASAGAALGVDGVPAVFVVNPKTRQVVPAVFGLVGWTELSQRVLYAIDHGSAAAHEPDAPAALTAVGLEP